MTAVGVLRASGFLDFLEDSREITTAAGIPPQIVPLGLVRLFSSSAATGLLLDIFKEFGADSSTGLMAGLMLGATESVFYCMSVYFGSVKDPEDPLILWPEALNCHPGPAWLPLCGSLPVLCDKKKLIRSLIFGKINIFNVFFVYLSGIYRRADGIVFSGRIYYSIMIWVRKIIRYSFYRVAYDVANVTQKSWEVEELS